MSEENIDQTKENLPTCLEETFKKLANSIGNTPVCIGPPLATLDIKSATDLFKALPNDLVLVKDKESILVYARTTSGESLMNLITAMVETKLTYVIEKEYNQFLETDVGNAIPISNRVYGALACLANLK
jgi:hypothetical protein